MQDLSAAISEAPTPSTGHSLKRKAPALSQLDAELQNPDDGIDASLSDVESPTSLKLDDGPPVVQARPYQKEMLEESVKRNIIVAVHTRAIWLKRSY